MPLPGKTLALLTESASYEIVIPIDAAAAEDARESVSKYRSLPQIHVTKHQKKSNKDVDIDIRPMIQEIDGSVDNNNIMLTVLLAAGSTSNLSPEMVLTTFCESAGIQYDRSEVTIHRTGIFFGEMRKQENL